MTDDEAREATKRLMQEGWAEMPTEKVSEAVKDAVINLIDVAIRIYNDFRNTPPETRES